MWQEPGTIQDHCQTPQLEGLYRDKIINLFILWHANSTKSLYSRSVFKPFIFVPHISPLLDTKSPTFEPERPVAKKPYVKPDRRHPLYQKHQEALEMISNSKVWLGYSIYYIIKNSLRCTSIHILNFRVLAFFLSFMKKIRLEIVILRPTDGTMQLFIWLSA